MYFVDNFNPVFRHADPIRCEVWTKLMSVQDRNWSKLYHEFLPELNRYIQAVCLNSLSSDDARSELQELRTFFNWNESYSRVWEMDVAVPSIEVDYSSLEELLQSNKYGSEPEDSAYDAWDLASGELDISWGSPYPAMVSVTSLRLK